MKKHIIQMIIGCTLTLLLIFFAPILGLGENVSLFVFILAMFSCHLLMQIYHDRNGKYKEHFETNKTENHESH